jgi:hypothetical protein
MHKETPKESQSVMEKSLIMKNPQADPLIVLEIQAMRDSPPETNPNSNSLAKDPLIVLEIQAMRDSPIETNRRTSKPFKPAMIASLTEVSNKIDSPVATIIVSLIEEAINSRK